VNETKRLPSSVGIYILPAAPGLDSGPKASEPRGQRGARPHNAETAGQKTAGQKCPFAPAIKAKFMCWLTIYLKSLT